MYPSLMRLSNSLFSDFDQLQRQLDLLAGASSLPSSIRAVGRGAFPAINIGTTKEAVEIYALAPGIDAGKIELSVDKGLLTIAGERPSEVPRESDKLSVYAQERYAGAFRRVVSLPDNVDISKVDASYRDGVLRIVIPMLENAKARQIEVRSLS
ncbi:Hsp20/alpha crystallin family protein [soil metagenome]